MEVLIQFVLEYFMGLSRLCPWLFGADDGAQTHLLVHVFMDGRSAVAVPRPFQIGGHAAVAIHSFMAVVDATDLLLNLCFLGIIICLPVLPVVIVGIRAERQPPQQPADTEFLMMLVNKSISL